MKSLRPARATEAVQFLARIAEAVQQPQARELVSWQARLIGERARIRLSRSSAPPTVTLPMFGTDLQAYRLGDLAFLVDEVFLYGAYDVGPLPDDPVIVDCGANIGIASVFFIHTYPGARVLAFEPDPSSFALLKENVSSLTGVTAHNLALGRRTGDIEFYVDRATLGSPVASGIRERQPDGDTIIVKCVRLSAMLPSHVDLLKIDVEGMEWDILTDLEDSGALTQVDRLAVEYHHHLPPARNDLSEFLGRLESAGFGYGISAAHQRRQIGPSFQDVMIYAYRQH